MSNVPIAIIWVAIIKALATHETHNHNKTQLAVTLVTYLLATIGTSVHGNDFLPHGSFHKEIVRSPLRFDETWCVCSTCGAYHPYKLLTLFTPYILWFMTTIILNISWKIAPSWVTTVAHYCFNILKQNFQWLKTVNRSFEKSINYGISP